MDCKKRDWMPYVTLFGIIVTVFTVLYTNRENRELEKLQYESSIIVKVLETGPDSIKHNIQKLVNAGVLDSQSERVIKIMNDTTLNVLYPKKITLLLDSVDKDFGPQKHRIWRFHTVDESGLPVAHVKVRTKLYKGLKRNNDQNSFYSQCVTDSLGIGEIELPYGAFVIHFDHTKLHSPAYRYNFEDFNFPETVIMKDRLF